MALTPSLSDLGALILRRREELGLGRRKAAAAAGLAPMTWNNVEDGKPTQSLTHAAVERALHWPSGSVRHYLDTGTEPTPLVDDRTDEGPGIFVASTDALLEELGRRHRAMREELARLTGPLLAAAQDTETAESVRARGMLPLRPEGGEGNDDAAQAGQS